MAEIHSPSERFLIDTLNQHFSSLHERSCVLVQRAGNVIYDRSDDRDTSIWSAVGENALRSVGVVEQTCGGLLSNLWDDPFEWTLAETLSTGDDVLEYLREVEATRQRAFSRLVTDADLFKAVSLPSEQLRPLIVVILDTLVRAVEYHGRAVACLEFLTTRGHAGGII